MINDLTVGGAQRALLSQAEGLDRDRLEVHVASLELAPDGGLSAEFRDAGLTVHALASPGEPFGLAPLRLHRPTGRPARAGDRAHAPRRGRHRRPYRGARVPRASRGEHAAQRVGLDRSPRPPAARDRPRHPATRRPHLRRERRGAQRRRARVAGARRAHPHAAQRRRTRTLPAGARRARHGARAARVRARRFRRRDGRAAGTVQGHRHAAARGRPSGSAHADAAAAHRRRRRRSRAARSPRGGARYLRVGDVHRHARRRAATAPRRGPVRGALAHRGPRGGRDRGAGGGTPGAGLERRRPARDRRGRRVRPAAAVRFTRGMGDRHRRGRRHARRFAIESSVAELEQLYDGLRGVSARHRKAA